MPIFTSIHRLSRNRTKPSVLKKKQTHLVLGTPIQSVADKSLYKTIRLRNGLTALLISDPTETRGKKMAACALSVGVGSFSNPPNIQGLAHFVEHMVFLGSEMYPKENEFSAFITENGGMSNAMTDSESTTFFFDMLESDLSEAMDMFSQFFVSPLMSKEAMQREREAIESEFAIATPLDDHRKDQLLAGLFREDHPARTFARGNLRSFREDLKDDERLYCEADKFRRRYYSAHRMTVAVQASMDLSTLERYVGQTFGQISSNALSPDDFSRCAYSVDTVTPEFRSLYYVKPISDICEVHITWTLRSLLSEYQSKPHQYITFLLGHEGKGSLLSYLRKKIWAVDIRSDNMDSDFGYTSMYSLLTMRIALTKDGLEHLDEVVEAVFSYLNKLRYCGPVERIFNEMKSLADNRFRYENKTQPAKYVTTLVENMHLYPPEHYITGNRLYYKYDPEGIVDILDSLRADMVNIMVLSSNHTKPVQYDAKEKWFGTEYKREEIPQEWLQRWANVAPYSEFQIPEKNVYITTNFDIIPKATPYVETAERLGLDLETSSYKDIQVKMAGRQPETKTFKKDDLIATINNFRLDKPNLFLKNGHMELWYKPDFKWRLPTALLYFYFIVPLGLLTPRETCLLDLWNDILQQRLKEDLYLARVADLSHEMFSSNMGLMLKISGYSENLHLLVNLTTSCMRSSMENVNPQWFKAVREMRTRIYHNQVIQPIDLAEDVLMNILLEPYISPRDQVVWVYNITFEELLDFGPRLLKKMYLQVLIEGNIQWHQAINIAEKVHHDLNWEGLTKEEFPEFKVHQLPLGERRVRVKSLNKFSTNSAVINYYQGGVATSKHMAVLIMIQTMMYEPVFAELHRKEQLTDEVFNMFRYMFGVFGFSVTVNTRVDKASVKQVDKRVDEFIKTFLRYLPKIAAMPTPTNKVIAQLNPIRDFAVKDEMDRNWLEILSREYNFQRRFQQGNAMKTLKLADIRDWMMNYFFSGMRKLSVQIVGHNVTAGNPELDQTTGFKLAYLNARGLVDEDSEKASEFITDIDNFRKDLPFIKVSKVQPEQS